MPEIYGIVYKATNRINGKMYIGQTVKSLNKRISEHISDATFDRDTMYFHKAIRKYSEENFAWEIVVECNSLEELNRIEIEMIKRYNTFKNGYNLTKGGEGKAGFKHTEESKKKIAKSLKGKKGFWSGKHRTEEAKRKQSESMKGEKHPNYGKHRSEETKKKISKSRKGKNIGKDIGSKSPVSKKYIITTPKGEEIFVHGIVNFCRNYKEERLNYRHLIEVARGKYKQHKGYKCRYYVEPR